MSDNDPICPECKRTKTLCCRNDPWRRHRASLKFKEIQCVSVKNTSVTQTDCLMFGLDEYGQMWEKRLQDSTWTRTPMKVEE